MTAGDGLEGEAGVLVLAADGSIVMSDAAGERWLSQLGTGPSGASAPQALAAVAARARGAIGAVARVCAPSGGWLVVRASILRGAGGTRTALTIGPARAGDLAPVIADAHELTERERAVTRLVAHGLATGVIAERLRISPWTVQDHLKAIFEKLGVSTRGELVARVFSLHGTADVLAPGDAAPTDPPRAGGRAWAR